MSNRLRRHTHARRHKRAHTATVTVIDAPSGLYIVHTHACIHTHAYTDTGPTKNTAKGALCTYIMRLYIMHARVSIKTELLDFHQLFTDLLSDYRPL